MSSIYPKMNQTVHNNIIYIRMWIKTNNNRIMIEKGKHDILLFFIRQICFDVKNKVKRRTNILLNYYFISKAITSRISNLFSDTPFTCKSINGTMKETWSYGCNANTKETNTHSLYTTILIECVFSLNCFNISTYYVVGILLVPVIDDKYIIVFCLSEKSSQKLIIITLSKHTHTCMHYTYISTRKIGQICPVSSNSNWSILIFDT